MNMNELEEILEEAPYVQELKDYHAFKKLDELGCFIEGRSWIYCSEHDQFWLNIDMDKLLEVIDRDTATYLGSCGASIDDGTISFFT